MHFLGKILLFFVMIGAAAATALTAKLLQVRNSWTKQVAAATEINAKQAKELQEKERAVLVAREELQRDLVTWDKGWDLVTVAATPDGIQLQVGSDQGLKARGVDNATGDPPTVHAFEIAADGTSKYHGGFQVRSVQQNSAEAVPVSRLLPGESDSWNLNAKWRFRQFVEPATIARTVELDRAMRQGQADLAVQQSNLDKLKNEQLAAAGEALATRNADLVGDGNATPPKVGLLRRIEFEDERRNAVVREVDALRRMVKGAFARLQELKAENDRLAGALPGAGAAPPSTVSND
jgi:hypothetical protein